MARNWQCYSSTDLSPFGCFVHQLEYISIRVYRTYELLDPKTGKRGKHSLKRNKNIWNGTRVFTVWRWQIWSSKFRPASRKRGCFAILSSWATEMLKFRKIRNWDFHPLDTFQCPESEQKPWGGPKRPEEDQKDPKSLKESWILFSE